MKKYTRRDFLRASALAGGAAFIAACAPVATPTLAPTDVPAVQPPADLPFEIAPGAENPFGLAVTDVDGVFFAGGYGDDYIKFAASMMEQAYPGMKVGVQSGQRIGDILRPRFVGGNPPDVIDNSGAGNLDMAALVADGQVADLAELLNAPALDTPGKTVGESLIPGSQDDQVYDGKQLAINFVFTGYGICYSKKLFDDNQWTYPATWEEMITFCDMLKSEGKIAPWTHQAKYPYYIQNMVLFPLIYSAGGNDLLVKIDNLEPNAWKDPAVLRAVENYYMLYDKGWLLEGTAGLDHTSSQAEFYKGTAAFIPCGGWLENEMKTILPADFDTTMAICPPFADGVGNPKAAQTGGGEPFIVPSKAKNVKHGMEYLRFLMSKAEAKYFAENVLSISAVQGGLEGAKASTFMKAQVEMANTAAGDVIIQHIGTWYTAMWQVIEAETTNLLTGKSKPAEFIDRIQASADATAKDPDIVKYKREK
jgi:N-acetylglucosamine transport system substrate-binding protein